VRATDALLVIAAVWVAIGIATAIAMARRGHHPWTWFLIGASLGPLAIPIAVSAAVGGPRRAPRTVETGERGTGAIDVLIGIDGSDGSLAAARAADALFRSETGRIALASVIEVNAARTPSLRERERRLTEALRAAAAGMHGVPTTVVLEGAPAEALERYALAEGYAVLVVGRRGRSMSKAVLGSVASTLARGCEVPVLIV
jgi:nucleotide-binding universal stress UspA family protein